MELFMKVTTELGDVVLGPPPRSSRSHLLWAS